MKLRVVFDASSGLSLKEMMLVGPNVQDANKQYFIPIIKKLNNVIRTGVSRYVNEPLMKGKYLEKSVMN